MQPGERRRRSAEKDHGADRDLPGMAGQPGPGCGPQRRGFAICLAVTRHPRPEHPAPEHQQQRRKQGGLCAEGGDDRHRGDRTEAAQGFRTGGEHAQHGNDYRASRSQ